MTSKSQVKQDISSLLTVLTEKKGKKYLTIYWKPSVPTCAYTVHIGLAILVKLERTFGPSANLKIKLFMKPGAHKQQKISM
jgi:hypothetical protein